MHKDMFLPFLRRKIFFKVAPGYLPAVLCLWSQARPCGFILQLPWWCSFQLHHHLLIYHCSSCKVSAQIQLRALQRYYDTKPNTTILKGVNPEMIVRLAVTWHTGWKISEISRVSMTFVKNQNKTSCSWSEWLDLQIEQLKNVHDPKMKKDV